MTGDADVQRGQRKVSRQSGGAQVGSFEKQSEDIRTARASSTPKAPHRGGQDHRGLR